MLRGRRTSQQPDLVRMHFPRPNTALSQQLAVLLPTLGMSWLLGYAGVQPAPRLAASLGFGAVLIAVLAYTRRAK